MLALACSARTMFPSPAGHCHGAAYHQDRFHLHRPVAPATQGVLRDAVVMFARRLPPGWSGRAFTQVPRRAPTEAGRSAHVRDLLMVDSRDGALQVIEQLQDDLADTGAHEWENPNLERFLDACTASWPTSTATTQVGDNCHRPRQTGAYSLRSWPQRPGMSELHRGYERAADVLASARLRQHGNVRQQWRRWLPGPKHGLAHNAMVYSVPRHPGPEQLHALLGQHKNLQEWARLQGSDLDPVPESLALQWDRRCPRDLVSPSRVARQTMTTAGSGARGISYGEGLSGSLSCR